MNTLYELIDLFPPSFKPPWNATLRELYYALRKRRYREEELIECFLSEKKSKNYFNKLKSQLKRELLNSLLTQASIWADTAHKDLFDRCHKEYAAYKILLASGSRTSGIQLATNLLSRTRKLELFEISYNAAHDLEHHYSVINPSAKTAKRYGQIADVQLAMISAERLILKKYCSSLKRYHAKHRYSQADLDFFRTAQREVEGLLHYGSEKLNRFIYNIIIIRCYAEYDYPGVIDYCSRALEAMEEGHFNQSLRFAFLYKTIAAQLVLGDYATAKDNARVAAGMISRGKYNWHLITMKRIIICFYAGDYQEAYELYRAHARYACPYPLLVEYWLVIKGYLNELIKIVEIATNAEERIRLGKILKVIPHFEKDKAGLNINVLLIQILVQMIRGQYGAIIDRIDALRAYTRRYLQQNRETTRAYLLLRMILKMDEASYHRISTERKTAKLRAQLAATPLHLGQSLAVELLPYGVIWTAILELLDTKFRQPRRRSRSQRLS